MRDVRVITSLLVLKSALLINFSEDPRFDQSATPDHEGIDTMNIAVFFCIFPCQDISAGSERSVAISPLATLLHID